MKEIMRQTAAVFKESASESTYLKYEGGVEKRIGSVITGSTSVQRSKTPHAMASNLLNAKAPIDPKE